MKRHNYDISFILILSNDEKLKNVLDYSCLKDDKIIPLANTILKDKDTVVHANILYSRRKKYAGYHWSGYFLPLLVEYNQISLLKTALRKKQVGINHIYENSRARTLLATAVMYSRKRCFKELLLMGADPYLMVDNTCVAINSSTSNTYKNIILDYYDYGAGTIST